MTQFSMLHFGQIRTGKCENDVNSNHVHWIRILNTLYLVFFTQGESDNLYNEIMWVFISDATSISYIVTWLNRIK